MATATQVQLRRGTDTEVAAFTGAAGEVTPDMTNNRLVLHDGTTAGGHPQASEAYVDAAIDALPDGGGDLFAANNLSDLDDAVAARANIGAAGITDTDFFRGFAYNPNASNPTTKIDIGAGACRDSLNAYTINLASTLTKSVSAWAAGNGNGGLDTGTIGSGFYWIHVIYNPTSGDPDTLFSLSLNSPSLPSGYTARRVIGGFAYSGGILDFFTVGDRHVYKTAIVSVSSAVNPASQSARSLAVPLGAKMEVEAYLQAFDNTQTQAGFVIVRDPDLGSYTVNSAAADWFYDVGEFAIMRVNLRTNSTGQVVTSDTNATSGNGRITLRTESWRFDRSVYR